MNEKYIDKFIDYLKLERQLSENTYNSYQIDLMQFNNYTNNQIDNISKQELDNYVSYLQSAYKENSYLRKIAALKSLNKYLRTQNMPYNEHIDMLAVRKREKKLPKFLTQDQIDLFLDQLNDDSAINSRDWAMFETLYATGMRVSEIINLNIEDVNLDNGTIRVTGKGNKQRLVLINQSASNSLRTYIDRNRTKLLQTKSNVLFLNTKGNKLTRQGFTFILKKYANNVGITEISPHIFRHSIATHMLNNGGDLRMIQVILGHANISTTEVYTHVSKQKILEEYNKLHPLAKERNNE